MVDDSILKTLQPGDVIKIASSEDLWKLNYDESIGLTGSMERLAGCEFTVWKIVAYEYNFVQVYVEENSFWWRGTFIEDVYHAEEPVLYEETELLNLLRGGGER